jgi:hypothetical protein
MGGCGRESLERRMERNALSDLRNWCGYHLDASASKLSSIGACAEFPKLGKRIAKKKV